MKTPFKIAGRVLIYAGLAGLAGLGIKGCNDLFTYLDKQSSYIPIKRTEDQYFSNKPGSFLDQTHDEFGHDMFVVDEDNDGRADVFQYGGQAKWIAKGHKSKRYFVYKDTKTMTSEIQEAATESLKADRKLAQLVAQESYRLQEQEKEKEGE